MAAGWLKSELKRLGKDQEFEVVSCGVFARKGVPVTFEAELILKNEEIDIANHHSQPLSREMVESATHILAMAEEHRTAILELFPGTGERIRVLNVEDPIGKDFQVYKECFEKIKKEMKEIWPWLMQ
jgi:protein-tyrosine phosphatase